MSSYPFTIDNGHGERLTFLGVSQRNSIEYLEVENEVSPGSGPPMHLHFRQDESLTVEEGIMCVQIMGEEPRLLQPGESATFHRGQMHRFWNAGPDILRCKGVIWPRENIAYFLTEIYRSAAAGKDGRPGAFDSAWLLHHFRTEFDIGGIPGFVRNIIFPLTRLAGMLKGKHKKYKNAPAAYK